MAAPDYAVEYHTFLLSHLGDFNAEAIVPFTRLKARDIHSPAAGRYTQDTSATVAHVLSPIHSVPKGTYSPWRTTVAILHAG